MNEQPLPNSGFFKKVLTTFLFVLFLNLFLFRSFGPTGFVIVQLGTFLFLSASFAKSAGKILRTTLFVGAFLFITSFILLNRGNNFVAMLAVLQSLASLVLFTYCLTSRIPFVRSLMEFIVVPLSMGIAYLRSMFYSLPDIIAKEKILSQTKSRKSKITSSIVGLGLGMPLVIILVSLFSSADPIYSSYVSKIFQGIEFSEFFQRIIISAVLFGIFLPVGFIQRKSDFHSPLTVLTRVSILHELTIALTLVAITIASFLIIQGPYVFASVPFETNLSQFGVATYSEYVRKGFSELLLISLVLYGIVWAGLLFLRNKKPGEKSLLPVIQSVILVELLIFIFSIFRRILLYQNYHGWSLVRLYGGFFLLWMSGIVVFLALRHFWQKKYVVYETIFTAAIVLFVGFFNAEQFIVQNNPPTVNGKVDHVYLVRMSSDGFDGWKKSFDFTNHVLNENGLENNEVIALDDRRDIIYAGLIVRSLTNQYENLLFQYGTKEERIQYSKDVLAQTKQLAERRLRTFQANPSLSEQMREAENSLRTIEEMLKELEKKPYAQWSHELYLYSFMPQKFDDSIMQSFYYVSQSPPVKKEENKLSILYQWHYGDQKTYNRMKREIPYPLLLHLQKKYVELYRKVLTQPTDEQTVDIDISFSTPFLQPL